MPKKINKSKIFVLNAEWPVPRAVAALFIFFRCQIVSLADLTRVSQEVDYTHVYEANQLFEKLSTHGLPSVSLKICAKILRWPVPTLEAMFQSIITKDWYIVFCRHHVFRRHYVGRQIVPVMLAPSLVQDFFIAALNQQAPLDRASRMVLRPLLTALSAAHFCKTVGFFLKNLLLVLGLSFYGLVKRLTLSAKQAQTLHDIMHSVFWYEPRVLKNTVAHDALSEKVFIEELLKVLGRLPGSELPFTVNASSNISFDAGRNVSSFEGVKYLAPALTLGSMFELMAKYTALASVILVSSFTMRPFYICLPFLPVVLINVLIIKKFNFRLVLCSVSSASKFQPWLLACSLAKVPVGMIFYSANCLIPKIGLKEEPPEATVLKHVFVDYFIVWDQAFKAWLTERVGKIESQVLVAGPIMFASSKAPAVSFRDSPARGGKKVIGIFDVTPTSPATLGQFGWGKGIYYYDICRRFLEDVIDVNDEVFGDEAEYIFKLKRNPTPGLHDHRSLEFLSSLAQRLGPRFHRLSPETNPWSAIKSCDLVVGIAFTSIVEAAKSVGIPAVFYFPDTSYSSSKYKDSVITTKDKLKDWVRSPMPAHGSAFQSIELVQENLAKIINGIARRDQASLNLFR